MLRPYWIQLSTPSQASIEPEPLPPIEVFGILSTRWSMLSHLQSSAIVLCFLSESTRETGHFIHEEAQVRIHAHLQTVLTARDTTLDHIMDAINVTAIQKKNW